MYFAPERNTYVCTVILLHLFSNTFFSFSSQCQLLTNYRNKMKFKCTSDCCKSRRDVPREMVLSNARCGMIEILKVSIGLRDPATRGPPSSPQSESDHPDRNTGRPSRIYRLTSNLIPCMIRICLRNVDLPLSPAPSSSTLTCRRNACLSFSSIRSIS